MGREGQQIQLHHRVREAVLSVTSLVWHEAARFAPVSDAPVTRLTPPEGSLSCYPPPTGEGSLDEGVGREFGREVRRDTSDQWSVQSTKPLATALMLKGALKRHAIQPLDVDHDPGNAACRLEECRCHLLSGVDSAKVRASRWQSVTGRRTGWSAVQCPHGRIGSFRDVCPSAQEGHRIPDGPGCRVRTRQAHRARRSSMPRRQECARQLD